MIFKKLGNIPDPFGYEIVDLDLSKIPSYETKTIGLKYLEKLLLLFRNQKLTPKKLAKIALTWGKFEIKSDDRFVQHRRHLKTKEYFEQLKRVYLEGLPGITRVTMDKDDDGYYLSPIPFGEFDWHSDNASTTDPFDTIALYADTGTKGSYTQFLECVTPYQNASAEDRRTLDSLECYCTFNIDEMPVGYPEELYKIAYLTILDLDLKSSPLIQKSPYGHKGIKYNKITFGGFVGKSEKENKELVAWIESFLFKKENIYTHYWEDGDLLFIDQTVMLHKRPEQDCSRRNLYRILFNTSKLISLLPK